MLIEFSDSDAEVSEVDASEIISVSETFDDTVVLSATSDEAVEFTNSSTVGAGLVISSSLGASTDGFVSVGASEPLFTVVFSDLAVSELASDVTVLSAFLPAWLVTSFKITGSTGVAVVSSLI